MYGIVNKSIEELVKTNFGEEKWLLIKERSGIDIDLFLINEPYDDEITYKLAEAVKNEIGISLDDVFIVFGEWWIIKTGKEKYGSLMEAGGANLREFLINLPMFHNRIMLIYPKLTPPEFKVSNVEENSLHIHYYSKRKGLQGFVKGLLIGLGKMFNTPIAIDLIQSRESGNSHEVFKVIWL